MSTRDQVLEAALNLPFADRAFVVEQLESSLSEKEFASDELAAAWSAEIERRIDAYDRGEIQATDGDTALARMKTYLLEHRARKAQP